MVGAGIVIVALFALAAVHALLISGQIRLDDLRSEAASESEEIRRLRLRVAELESPDRVLDVARERLGMVAPDEVGYLLPVGVPGGPEEPVRVDAAVPPPPPEPDPVETGPSTLSPEEREVLATLDVEDAGTSDDATDEASGDATSDASDGPTDGASQDQAPSEGGPVDAAATGAAGGGE